MTWRVLLLSLLLMPAAWAEKRSITPADGPLWTEPDGAPTLQSCWKMSVTNGSLTNTGGNCTLTTSGGSGDITSVADCTTGACALADTTFASGSGFTWTMNAGATDPTMAFGSGTITLAPGGSDLTVSDDIVLSDSTPSLTITGGGRSYHLDGSGNQFRLADTTSNVDSIVINSAGQVTQLAGWRHPPAESYWLASQLDQIEHAADGFPVLTKNAGTHIDVYTLDHDDTARECSGGTYQVPDQADTNGTVEFLVEWFPSTAQTKGTVWSFNHVARKGGQAWDAQLSTVTSGISMASGTANIQQDAIWSASMATLGWQPNQLILFEVCREPSNAGDTLVGDAKLIGFGFSLARNRPGNP